MNLANKFTTLRVILIPLFVAALLIKLPCHYLIALAIFGAASITDAIDGHLARSRNMITSFGKFLDPLADKALVVSALVCLVELGWTWSVLVIIIILREFLVTSLRLVASSTSGEVIAASYLGKIKTTTQMITIALILAFGAYEDFFGSGVHNILYIIALVLMTITVVATIVSGVDYVIKYKGYIDTTK